MTVSIATFKAHFPEFADARAPDDLIAAKLDEADNQTNSETWGDLLDQGILYLAAHLLATSPFGQQARLASSDATSTYGNRYDRLAKSSQVGLLRTTSCPTVIV